jgi:VanZ family protein
MPCIQSRRFAWTTVGCLALVIAILSLTPEPEEIVPVALWDKLSHFLAYGSLALTLGHALSLSGWSRGRLIAGGVLLSTAYGGLLEGLQFFTPPRTPDLVDAFSNFLGSCAGMASLLLLNMALDSLARRTQRRRTR